MNDFEQSYEQMLFDRAHPVPEPEPIGASPGAGGGGTVVGGTPLGAPNVYSPRVSHQTPFMEQADWEALGSRERARLTAPSVADVARSTLKGSLAGTGGIVGDLESVGRMLGDWKQKFPTTETVHNWLQGMGITALPSQYIVGTTPPGMLTQGNVDVANRPIVKNPDGSVSTVRSLSFNDNGREILIPTVTDEGGEPRVLSDDEAVEAYRKSGKHLGMFDTPENATAYAELVHQHQMRNLSRMKTSQAAQGIGEIFTAETPVLGLAGKGGKVLAKSIRRVKPARALAPGAGAGVAATTLPDEATAGEAPGRFSVKNGELWDSGTKSDWKYLESYIERQKRAIANNEQQGPMGEIANRLLRKEVEHAEAVLKQRKK